MRTLRDPRGVVAPVLARSTARLIPMCICIYNIYIYIYIYIYIFNNYSTRARWI